MSFDNLRLYLKAAYGIDVVSADLESGMNYRPSVPLDGSRLQQSLTESYGVTSSRVRITKMFYQEFTPDDALLLSDFLYLKHPPAYQTSELVKLKDMLSFLRMDSSLERKVAQEYIFRMAKVPKNELDLDTILKMFQVPGVYLVPCRYKFFREIGMRYATGVSPDTKTKKTTAFRSDSDSVKVDHNFSKNKKPFYGVLFLCRCKEVSLSLFPDVDTMEQCAVKLTEKFSTTCTFIDCTFGSIPLRSLQYLLPNAKIEFTD